MSTRSVIARRTKTGFRGCYHHWDGYPSGVGRTLWTIYRTHFGRDIGRMLSVLIDEHQNGWSTINADWDLPSECRSEGNAPSYYDDGSGEPVTEQNASGAGCEYAYAFDGPKMVVLSSVYGDGGGKAIGAFGCGDPDGRWVVTVTIDLDDDTEPDWDRVDQMADEVAEAK